MEYKAQYQEYLRQATAALDAASARFLPEESEVCRAARYSLLGGGKRIRAILTLSVCDMLGGEMQVAAQFAAAVEMLHCYSLIHDDLPCMDNDDLRRGRPSCHKAFSESTAMLAGDVLLTEAFEVSLTESASEVSSCCICARIAFSRSIPSSKLLGALIDLLHRFHTASCLILPTAHTDELLRLQLLHGADLPFCIGHKGIATGQHTIWIQRCSQCSCVLKLHAFVIHTRFLLRPDSLLYLLQTV